MGRARCGLFCLRSALQAKGKATKARRTHVPPVWMHGSFGRTFVLFLIAALPHDITAPVACAANSNDSTSSSQPSRPHFCPAGDRPRRLPCARPTRPKTTSSAAALLSAHHPARARAPVLLLPLVQLTPAHAFRFPCCVHSWCLRRRPSCRRPPRPGSSAVCAARSVYKPPRAGALRASRPFQMQPTVTLARISSRPGPGLWLRLARPDWPLLVQIFVCSPPVSLMLDPISQNPCLREHCRGCHPPYIVALCPIQTCFCYSPGATSQPSSQPWVPRRCSAYELRDFGSRASPHPFCAAA